MNSVIEYSVLSGVPLFHLVTPLKYMFMPKLSEKSYQDDVTWGGGPLINFYVISHIEKEKYNIGVSIGLSFGDLVNDR
jgi:hypothetical protein